MLGFLAAVVMHNAVIYLRQSIAESSKNGYTMNIEIYR
jgi:hypothetical protein